MNLAKLKMTEIKILGEVRSFKGKQADVMGADLRQAKEAYKVWLNIEITTNGQKGWQLLECEYSGRNALLASIDRYTAKGGKDTTDQTKFGKAIDAFSDTAYAAEYMPRQKPIDIHGRKGAAK